MGGGPCRCGQHPAGGWMTRIASLRSGDLPLPPLAGTAEAGGSLADFIWFRTGGAAEWLVRPRDRSEEHTSELQSLMRISYAVFCLKKKNTKPHIHNKQQRHRQSRSTITHLNE